MSATTIVPVVGVTFVPSYPTNLWALAEAMRQPNWRVGHEGPSVVLVRNPDNPHDANAIEVHVPGLGAEHAMIGHVSRAIAARLAPLLDAGVAFETWVCGVRIRDGHEDRPGIDIAIRRAEVPAHAS